MGIYLVIYVKYIEITYKKALLLGNKFVPLRRFKSGLWPDDCKDLIVWQ